MDIYATHLGASAGLGALGGQPAPQREPRPVPVAQEPQVLACQPILRRGNPEAYEQAERFARQKSGYDQPDGRKQQAIEAYQSLQQDARRAEITRMLGVDTYA